jgi:phosphatidylglycerophosphate synthase
MLDAALTRLLRPVLGTIARALTRLGISANALTFTGFALGMGAATAIALGAMGWGAALIAVSRLADGLDGAVARQTQATDRGGFLDITLDFVFYASIPFAFALHQPQANALPAAALLAAFMGTGASFLAFAAVAARRGMVSTQWPDKSIYFLGGLTEASETLAFFMAMCLWPHAFAPLAWGFAALCVLTAALRLVWGWQAFAGPCPTLPCEGLVADAAARGPSPRCRSR